MTIQVNEYINPYQLLHTVEVFTWCTPTKQNFCFIKMRTEAPWKQFFKRALSLIRQKPNRGEVPSLSNTILDKSRDLIKIFQFLLRMAHFLFVNIIKNHQKQKLLRYYTRTSRRKMYVGCDVRGQSKFSCTNKLKSERINSLQERWIYVSAGLWFLFLISETVQLFFTLTSILLLVS